MTKQQTSLHMADAETALLAGVIVDNRRLDEIIKLGIVPSKAEQNQMGERLFRDSAKQETWDAIGRLYQAGKRFDLVIVSAEVDRVGRYEMVGGAAFFAMLLENIDSTLHTVEHARVVAEKWMLRAMMGMLDRVGAKLREGPGASEALEMMQNLMAELDGLKKYEWMKGENDENDERWTD